MMVMLMQTKLLLLFPLTLLLMKTKKILALVDAADGPPDPEEMAERMNLSAQARMMVRTATVFIVIAVGTMASASWV